MKHVRTALRLVPFLFLAACSDDKSNDANPSDSETTRDASKPNDGRDSSTPVPSAKPPDQDAAATSDAPDADTPEPAPDAMAPEPDGGMPTAPTCVDVFGCFMGCDDDTCLDGCAEGADYPTTFNAYYLYQCAVTSQCQDDACLIQNCLPEVNACTGQQQPEPLDTCSEVFGCFVECEDEACLQACAGAATDEDEAIAAYYLLECALNADCADDTCLADNCSAEVLACAGTGADGGAPATDCPAPTGPGTEHQGFIEADETWTAESGPHILTSNVDVRGATLTIEPCAQVIVNEGYHINVGQNPGEAAAALIAKGEKIGAIVRPVTFTSAATNEFWGGIATWPTGMSEFEYAIIERAGHENGPGVGHPSAIVAQGDDNRTAVVANVSLKHVTIKDSAGIGLSSLASGGFTSDSTDVTVTGCGIEGGKVGDVPTAYAAYMEAPAIHTLPPGDYTGNAIDAVLAKAPFTLTVDETFHNPGVPYQLVSQFHMVPATAGAVIDLVLDPGVTVRSGGEDFSGGSGFWLGDQDGDRQVRVTADGTSAAPITLTSGAMTPVAGDWSGVYWEAAPATGNTLDYVTIEYAGGESGTNGFGCGPGDNDSALFLSWEPTEAFITNSTIRDSLEGGIVSGWESDAQSPNLSDTNAFYGIGNGCNVSVNKDENGACATSPACY